MYFTTFIIVWAVLVVLVWRGIWKATKDDRDMWSYPYTTKGLRATEAGLQRLKPLHSNDL